MELIGAGIKSRFKCSDFASFEPRWPWLGGDLQTLRNNFASIDALLPDERLLATISAGAISVAVNHPSKSLAKRRSLILVHGLGGNEDSSYMASTARYFLATGYHVFRMNYRGVGASAAYSLPPYNAGLTDDLRAVVDAVIKVTKGVPIYLMGFSLGGQLILRMLGEGQVPVGVAASVTVSAPLDLSTAQQKLERCRNALYTRYVVANMRRDLGAIKHPEITVDISKLSRVRDFDEYVIAPVFGYDGAADYYAKVSCYGLLRDIRLPVLAIHSVDDPWIPVEDYRSALWPATVPAGALITKSGGHVGFHANGHSAAWYEQATASFFNAVL